MTDSVSIAPLRTASFPVGEARILHLHYATRYGLCASFLRLQEFYESDIEGIRGRFFTLETFMDAYARRMGNFTYTTDWGGFNVPARAWRAWRTTFPDPTLLEKEKVLVTAVEDLLGPDGTQRDFYLIGSSEESRDLRGLVGHETAHALFALLPAYRQAMTGLVQAWREASPGEWQTMTEKLLSMGYMEDVLIDEVQAYLATSDDKDLYRHFSFAPLPERARFQAAFTENVQARGIAHLALGGASGESTPGP